jgi:predicted small metal-binding protein
MPRSLAALEARMVKVFECGSVVPGCNHVIHAEDESELMVEAIRHLRSAHEVEHLTERLKARLRAVIKDE